MEKFGIMSQRFSRSMATKSMVVSANRTVFSNNFALASPARSLMGTEANRYFANKIVYTLTDEAPALATRALLPIYEKFARV
jgi:hypothetical protein